MALCTLSTHVLWLDSCKQDLREAFRGWRRNPAFTAVLIATLALGIGACTAVFSMVDRLLFRSLPYPRAHQLVSVGINGPLFAALLWWSLCLRLLGRCWRRSDFVGFCRSWLGSRPAKLACAWR
jgi:hypothetical protein